VADHHRHTLLGKTSAPATSPQLRVLVQQLLTVRFALQLHREQRETVAYQLVFARGDRRLGSNIKPAAFDCTPFLTGQRPTPIESPLWNGADGRVRRRTDIRRRKHADVWGA
jgi:uncharacterized protein (TIGR03435 family)